LSAQFERFTDYLHGQLGWRSDVPTPVSFEEFSAAHEGTAATSDLWAGRFLRMSRDMEQLARLAPAHEPQEVYMRYRHWLPFAYRCDRAMSAVSEALDYQPVLLDRPASQMPIDTVE
jgi:hypothetical protein